MQESRGRILDNDHQRGGGNVTVVKCGGIIIIIIKRKDLGGVMSKDCKDTVQTLRTATKRDCDAKERIE